VVVEGRNVASSGPESLDSRRVADEEAAAHGRIVHVPAFAEHGRRFLAGERGLVECFGADEGAMPEEYVVVLAPMAVPDPPLRTGSRISKKQLTNVLSQAEVV
jgi:hypothetical protein